MAEESLGEAYVTVNADTTAFKAQLSSAVTKATAAAEKANKKSADKMAADSEKAANKAAAADVAAHEKAQKAIANIYKLDALLAKSASDAQIAADKEFEKAHAAVMAEAAAASKAAYTEMNAAAAASSRARILEEKAYLAQVKAAAVEAAAVNKASSLAFSNSFKGGFSKQFEGLAKDFGGTIGNLTKSIPADIFGAITTSAAYAVIGVVGLGTALAAIGIENAAKQQAAVVGFTALADQITATTDATTGLNKATTDLSQSQKTAIGKDFLQQLIQLSNNSALSQSALQDTTQQLLALGFNGKQSIGIVHDIGNALAASGKSGGQLNEDLGGIVTAFAQIKGSGRLLAQDLNQITTRIPAATRVKVYQELAKDLKLAGASAKDGTPEFAKMTKEVQKLAKAGDIDADTAIASITKVLEQVPGAAKDAGTGLDALGRQNLTLAGRFEALKDNVRTALANAFLIPGEGGDGKSLADQFSDQLGKLIPQITSSIAQIGPTLGTFVSQFGELAITVLPKLLSLVGTVFTVISNGISAATTSGNPLNDLFVGIGKTVQGLVPIFKFLFDNLLPIVAALGPAFRIFGDLVIVLGDVVGALDKVTRPIVFLASGAIYGSLHLLADVFDLLASAASKFGDAADYIQKKFIRAIDFVLSKVEDLIKALDFHVGPIHIEVPGADAAIAKIEDVRNGLNSIPTTVTSVVNIVSNPIDANGTIIHGGVLNGQTVHDSESARVAGINAAAVNKAKSTADDLINNALKHHTTPDDTGTGTDTAAAKAKAAADKIKAAFADLAGDLKTIGDKTSEQTSAQIKANFKALIKDLKDSGNGALVAGAQKVEDKLLADVKKLKPVQDKLKAELTIAQGIKDKIVDLGSVTQSNDGIGTTFLGLQNQLRRAIANTQRFTQDIKQLQALHLNRTTIQQLIEAGPVAGLPAAEALLRAGSAGISGAGGINELQGTLTGLGNDLANDTAGELYKAGQAAGDGLLEGLKDKESAIEAEINKIADNMIATMKTKFKSHSPSKVFEGIGGDAGDGLVNGITGSIGKVSAASATMAGAVINFGAGSIAVNGAVPRPEATGMMLGQGLVAVLNQRKTQAALNGTG